MKNLLVLCFLLTSAISVGLAQAVNIPKVPSEMEFAGMKLKITEQARRDIQKDVDALRQSPKYFNIKLDRVKLYFPIIEEALKQENVPEDFKYLAVQESGLVSDEVSSSNAVGFWQFKDFTGREVGLRIDRNVDERLNIVASTHGAAKYFKRHNFFFKNWVYTVLAHMTGRGGAQKYVDKKNFGQNRHTINGKTHWYVKRFLAFKIAFGKDENGHHSEGLKLVVYEKGGGMSISKIADNFGIDHELMAKYNKWLKHGKVPTDKNYAVIIPVKNKIPKGLIASKKGGIKAPKSQSNVQLGENLNRNKTIFIKINGIPSILAKNNQSIESLAAEGGVSISQLLKYNDMKETTAIVGGETYYLRSKKNKSSVYYHTAEHGESLWEIAQKFGIKLNKLAKMNRMSIIDQPVPGRLMWLRKTRPKNVDVEIREIPSEKEIQEILKKDEKDTKKPVLLPAVPVADNPIETSPKASNDGASSKEGEYSIHVVKKGETLYAISKIYNVEVVELMDLNQSNGALEIGQELKLPKSAKLSLTTEEPIAEQEEEKSEKITNFHVVKPGDTFYSISKKYNLTVDQLRDLNQKNNFDLSIGEKLKITE